MKQDVINSNDKNIDSIDLNDTPEYELKFVDRTLKTNEEKVANEIKENLTVTYKYYEIAYNNEVIESVDTLEEATQIVEEVKVDNEELNLSIIEKYIQN